MNNDIVKKCVIAWVAHFMNTEPENISESTELSLLGEGPYFALFGNLDKVFGYVSDAADDNLARTVGDVIKIYAGHIPASSSYIIHEVVYKAIGDSLNLAPGTLYDGLALPMNFSSARCHIAYAIEKALDIAFNGSELAGCSTIKDIIELCDRKLAEKRYMDVSDCEDSSVELSDAFKRNYIIGAIATEAVVDKYSIKPETAFRELYLSSKDVADLIYDLEEEFDMHHPSHNYSEIKTVADLLKVFGIAPACDTGSPEELEAVKQAMDEDVAPERVNHPQHYALPNGLEAIDIARHLSFNLGNVVKYVVRAGRKSEQGLSNSEKRLEDLKKALFYLQDEINHLS